MVTTPPPSSVTARAEFRIGCLGRDNTQQHGFTGSVTANLYNQAHVLVGTKSVTNVAVGVATFAGLTLDAAASGYTITLSSTATGRPLRSRRTHFATRCSRRCHTGHRDLTPPARSLPVRRSNVTVKLEDSFRPCGDQLQRHRDRRLGVAGSGRQHPRRQHQRHCFANVRQSGLCDVCGPVAEQAAVARLSIATTAHATSLRINVTPGTATQILVHVRATRGISTLDRDLRSRC